MNEKFEDWWNENHKGRWESLGEAKMKKLTQEAFAAGHQAGYSEGYDDGYSEGYAVGSGDGASL